MRKFLTKPLSIFGHPAAGRKARQMGIPREHIAAIAIALHRYSEELNRKPALTISRTSGVRSAWGSKIHGLRQLPNKKGRNERL